MNGLFHRLARQMVGPELPRARTEARLPFAGPPALNERNIERPTGAAMPATEGDRPAARSGDAAEAARRDPGPALAPPPMLLKAEAATHAIGESPEGEPDLAKGEPPPITGATAAEAEMPTTADAAGHPAPPPRPLAERAERTGANPARDPRGAQWPLEGGPDSGDARVEPEAVGAPEPLMPELVGQRRTEHPARTHPSDPGALRPSAEREAPPEVHIHIGRIEVTSVSEPPPKRPERQRQGKPPMSLEDYLAKRAGRS